MEIGAVISCVHPDNDMIDISVKSICFFIMRLYTNLSVYLATREVC
jgi:hypothetical protein